LVLLLLVLLLVLRICVLLLLLLLLVVCRRRGPDEAYAGKGAYPIWLVFLRFFHAHQRMLTGPQCPHEGEVAGLEPRRGRQRLNGRRRRGLPRRIAAAAIVAAMEAELRL